ncbi:MAG: polysaccharide deacetylase family protein [Candidatus Eisenbacteria bacterium]|nr:polysaccharide deacetylase family protein [Candidatus Eisenbacteria bacterium]
MTRWLRWMLSLVPRREAAGPRLVVVRHHRIYPDGARPLYRVGVSESVFGAQLDLLVRVGLAPLTVEDGLAWLRGARGGLRVAMSFDDGYADNVRVGLPLLERHRARATFYLTAGLMEERVAPWWDRLAHRVERAGVTTLDWMLEGRHLHAPLGDERSRRAAMVALLPAFRAVPEVQQRRLHELAERLRSQGEPPCELATWDEARALVASAMEVGAHTLSHPHLSRLSPERQEAEIAGSIDRIENRLGTRPRGMAYPGGDYDAASVAACANHGLRYAVTTRRGDVHPGSAPFELPRRALSDGACLDPFGRFSERMTRAEIAGAFDHLRRAAEVAS